MKDKRLLIVLGAAAAALLFFALLASIFVVRYYFSAPATTETPVARQSDSQPANTQPSPGSGNTDIPFFPGLSESDSNTAGQANTQNGIGAAEIVYRLFISVILAAILAFRPRKNVPLFQRNLYVAQTQILLAVVAAALMMIVGDNAARAFAIFAAVSLVRFRTNIRDPKEITVLLISLALGLAAGVGRWELGAVLCLFSLVLLWVLEFKEPEQVFRSMEITVRTRNTEKTQTILKKIFNGYALESEVRQIDPEDETEPVGCIMYYLNLRLNITTDQLSDIILNSDPENIEGIQWEQKKNTANIFQ
jgi:hypothetical protein